MGITNDQFIRTTDEAHKRGVQKLFTTLQQRGSIYLDSYTGQYCVSEEMFVEGPPGTIGPDGRPTETVTEENFFFRLSEYQLPLLDLIESNTLVSSPNPAATKFSAFSRQRGCDRPLAKSPAGAALTWGIPVPKTLHLSGCPRSLTWGIPVRSRTNPRARNHVIYVWLDALANYMTAVGYGRRSLEDQPNSKSTGPPTSTSSARRSSASTASTGPPSCSPPACRCPKK